MFTTDNNESPWQRFASHYSAAGERAANAVASAVQDLKRIRADVARASLDLLPGNPISGLLELGNQFERTGDRLVVQPAAAWTQRRPLQAAETALLQFLDGVNASLRHIPESATVADIASMLQTTVPVFRRTGAEYPFRERLLEGLDRRHRRVVKTLSRVHSDLAFSSIRLLTPWTIWRQSQSSAVLGRPWKEAFIRDKLAKWQHESELSEGSTHSLLAELRAQLTSGLDAIGVLELHPLDGDSVSRFESELEAARRKWFGAQSTVSSFLENSFHGVELGRQMSGATLDSVLSADRENELLTQDLDKVLTWLRVHTPRHVTNFPEVRLRVMTPEERTEHWLTRLQAISTEHLPEVVEQAEQVWSVPVPAFVRRTNPRRLFHESLAEEKPAIAHAFHGVASANMEIARDLQQTREVLAFAEDSAREMDPQSEQIWNEAHANTLDLLEQRRRSARMDRRALEEAVLRILVRVSVKTQTARDRGQLRVLSYSTRSSWQRVVFEITEALRRSARVASRFVVEELKQWRDWIYRRVGLLPPALEVEAPVTKRAGLAGALQLRSGPRDLPVLYRHLFRLDPVTDPNFLIGREEEMTALSETHSRWTAGQPVAMIVVGARGSGKTSLLNCAEDAVFKSAPVYKLSLSERVRNWEQMQEFFCSNLQLPADCDLERELASQRRIIIFEEFERSYLRVIGGFDVARRLSELIEATARTTLWIVVLNRSAWSLLNQAVSLRDVASVRINAMSMRLDTLRSVILQRHNLSGLRLEFAPPPPGDPRVTRFQRALGLERDPADLFFERLYLESQGIFRSAFELWQDSIQRIEAGTLVMRQPVHPNYDPLLSELDLDDIFAIHAVAQHGSLTAQECAEIFDVAAAESRRRLGRLLDLDLLEPEPERPGFRLRSQAARLTVGILGDHNLL